MSAPAGATRRAGPHSVGIHRRLPIVTPPGLTGLAGWVNRPKMHAPRRCLLVVLLPALGAGGLVARAHATAPASNAHAVLIAQAEVSMDQAVKMVEQRFKARVVRAEAQRADGRTVYVLRLLNDSGHVWTVRVDAASGEIL